MEKDKYQEILEDAINEVISHFKTHEIKHGEGLTTSSRDIYKALSHCQRAINGETNPDGVSHTVAATSRCLKALLFEIATKGQS